MIIGTLLLLLSLYQLVWLLYDTLAAWNTINHQSVHVDYPFSYSLSLQFKKNPQSFLVGGVTFLAAIQFLGLGFLSLQNKRYFEELFHINSIVKKMNSMKGEDS